MNGKDMNITTVGIIVAAGGSSRMNGTDKILASLCGVPLFIHSLLAFEGADCINEIILVVKKENVSHFSNVVKNYSIKKLTSVIAGGDTRQQSVTCGVNAAIKSADFFAIHDGARPLVTSDIINRVVSDAVNHGAATAAMPVKDTIKISNDNGFISSTPERSELYICQTPQVFSADIYREGLSFAQKHGMTYTDDCQLVEAMDKPVYLSLGSYENIKVTTPEDLIVADAILTGRNGTL